MEDSSIKRIIQKPVKRIEDEEKINQDKLKNQIEAIKKKRNLSKDEPIDPPAPDPPPEEDEVVNPNLPPVEEEPIIEGEIPIIEGPPGPTGPIGPAGPKGDKGDPGDIGYNEYNVSCKAEQLLPSLQHIEALVIGLTDTMAKIEAMCIDTKSVVDDLLELNEHIHYSHNHPKGHYAEQGVHVEYGSYFLPMRPDESALLVNEYNNSLDKDDNGLIYGLDFIITNDDPRKPQILRGIDDMVLDSGLSLPEFQLSWDDYLATLPYDPKENTMPPRPNSTPEEESPTPEE